MEQRRGKVGVCANCAFWQRHGDPARHSAAYYALTDTGGVGTCYRYPPATPGLLRENTVFPSHRPSTMGRSWCGEFVRAEAEPSQVTADEIERRTSLPELFACEADDNQ